MYGMPAPTPSFTRALLMALVFVVPVALAVGSLRAGACGIVEMPAVFSAGRVFVTPAAAADGQELKFWVDSDGSGFLFEDIAKRYDTLTTPAGAMQQARLPALEVQRSIPPLADHHDALPIMQRLAVASDPLFQGLAGQLGASWLQGRVWTFDYRLGKLQWRCDGTEPRHAKSDEIGLSFAADADGKLLGGVAYPQLQVDVDGNPSAAALDTGASVALSQTGLAAIHDGGAAVRGTSFAKRELVARWHSQHPRWRYATGVGQSAGVDALLVPSVTAGNVRFRNVWFATRPGDDVFEGENVEMKIGATAFDQAALTIDYQRRVAIVQYKG
jgi:hypothetical protein